MAGNSNRTELKGAHVFSEPSGMPAVPAALLPVKKKTLDYFQSFLPVLFDHLDDTLFTMSEHATLHGEQTLLFDGMRSLRVERNAVCQRFAGRISQAFVPGDHLTEDVEADNHLEPVRAENLVLLSEDDLEEQLAIGGLLSRIKQGECGKQFNCLWQRMADVYALENFSADLCPVSPVIFGHSLLRAIEPLKLPLKIRLVVLKLFEQSFLAQVETFYRQLNNALQQQGIQPELEQDIRRQRAQAARDANGCSGPEGVPAGEQHTEPDPVISPYNAVPPVDHPGPVEAQISSIMNHEELMALLSLLQARQPEIEPGVEMAAGPTLRETMDIALAGTQGTRELNFQDNELINMVSMVFEFILENHSLNEPVKALIGRLQVPILKLALLDHNFLEKRTHCARRLLNQIAHVGMMASHAESNKRLYRKIEEVVVSVLQQFTTDITVFETLLGDIESFLQEEDRRLGKAKERMQEAEVARERSEQARLEVQDIIDEHIGEQELPEQIDKFLHEVWSDYLFIFALKHGRKGNGWKKAVGVVDHLVSCIQPGITQDEVTYSKELLSRLYKVIEASLKSISYDPCLIEIGLRETKAVYDDLLQKFADNSSMTGSVEEAFNELENCLQHHDDQENKAGSVPFNAVHAETQPLPGLLEPRTDKEEAVSTKELSSVCAPEPLENSFLLREVDDQENNQPGSETFDVSEKAVEGEAVFSIQEAEEPAFTVEPVLPAAEAVSELMASDEKVTFNELLFDQDADAEEIVLESSEGETELTFQETDRELTADEEQQLKPFSEGVSVTFSGDKGNFTCRVSSVSDKGVYRFENAQGAIVTELSRSELLKDIRRGHIQAIESEKSSQSFDRTIQTVFDNFRIFRDRN